MGRLVNPMIDFAKVERTVEGLNQQLSAGMIDRHALRTHLIEMIDFAEDGYFWMIGYQTGLWYRHDGAEWLVDNPDRIKSTLSLPPVRSIPIDGIFAQSSLSSSNHHAPKATQPAAVSWLWVFMGLILLGFIAGIIYGSV